MGVVVAVEDVVGVVDGGGKKIEEWSDSTTKGDKCHQRRHKPRAACQYGLRD